MRKWLAWLGLIGIGAGLQAQTPVPPCLYKGSCTVLVWLDTHLPAVQRDTLTDSIITPVLSPFQRVALEFVRGIRQYVTDSLAPMPMRWLIADRNTSPQVWNQYWHQADIVVPFGGRTHVQEVFNRDSLQQKVIVVSTWTETGCCPPHRFWIQWYPSVRQQVHLLMEQWRGREVILVVPAEPTPAEQEYVTRIQQLKDVYALKQVHLIQKEVVHQEDLLPYLDVTDTVALFVASLRLPLVFNVLEQVASIDTFLVRPQVYGLPTWMRFHQIDFNLLRELRPIITAAIFIRDTATYWTLYKTYLQTYRENLQGNSFFAGYDLAHFINRWLAYWQTYWRQEQPLYVHGVVSETYLEPMYVDSLHIGRWENLCAALMQFQTWDYQCIQQCHCTVWAEDELAIDNSSQPQVVSDSLQPVRQGFPFYKKDRIRKKQ